MDIDLKNINPKFTELFRETFAFTEEEFALFFSCFTVKIIPKKKYFLRAGECCRSKAYLNKGCARNFVLDEKGHERILFFSFEDWWLGDFDSYYSGKRQQTLSNDGRFRTADNFKRKFSKIGTGNTKT
jgi:hypothetical protein